MKEIPENSRDIKKLLYEQVPLLIEKLRICSPEDVDTVVEAIISIMVLP